MDKKLPPLYVNAEFHAKTIVAEDHRKYDAYLVDAIARAIQMGYDHGVEYVRKGCAELNGWQWFMAPNGSRRWESDAALTDDEMRSFCASAGIPLPDALIDA